MSFVRDGERFRRQVLQRVRFEAVTRHLRAATRVAAFGLALGIGAGTAGAQFAMPDPREMAGIPRPVGDLPDRTVSVRLIRGALSNNIADHAVEMHVDGKVQTVRTDEAGRAQFGPLTPGATLKAVAVVDGERLESQEFPAPTQGGIRLMLVATDKERAAGGDPAVPAPAVEGQVVLGRESRVWIEPDEERIRVFYLLEVTNHAQVPVNPPSPIMFDTPTGALGTTIMEGSSPQATASGTRVRIQGPFPPGETFVQVAYLLPTPTGSATIEQMFPITLEHLAVIVEKAGDATLSSPQIARQQEMPAEGRTFIAAAGGGPIGAGENIMLTLTGLPHHSRTPLWTAFALAIGIVLSGLLAMRRPDEPAPRASEPKRLVARREKLLQELVRLETDFRRGKADASRYGARREELLAALEHVYGSLDGDDSGPEPADRAGLAA
jgi:hypothetical protein